jgi:hypothetical protein
MCKQVDSFKSGKSNSDLPRAQFVPNSTSFEELLLLLRQRVCADRGLRVDLGLLPLVFANACGQADLDPTLDQLIQQVMSIKRDRPSR